MFDPDWIKKRETPKQSIWYFPLILELRKIKIPQVYLEDYHQQQLP